MKVDNRLTTDFLSQHASDAARVLEQLPTETVASFLLELSPAIRTPLITTMLPGKTAACFEILSEKQVVEIVSNMPTVHLARIFRVLPTIKRRALVELLPERQQRFIKRHLRFPQSTIGSLMESDIETLPVNISVTEALRRISHFNRDPEGEVYVIDELHRLVGVIEPGRLLRSNQRAKLSAVMKTSFPKLSASAEIETLVKNPAWNVVNKLPVTDRDKTLLGVIEYQKLQEVEVSSHISVPQNPIDNLVTLAAFYWINAAQLLVGIFGVVSKGQEDKR